ncbi:MFS transporter [Synechococcus sp. H60.3]|uniref:MDR family MFS transporter n=1 Tax=Synechococcus sp. H60.3 TaxID=2967124 RepID=UPI0039C1A166
MRIPSWWPQLSFQVWLIFVGRLLSQTGTGFALFYTPLFFVDQVGLRATQVGLGLGLMALSGVLGRILGGSMADGAWGRRSTLILSLAISAAGSFGFALSQGFYSFALASLVAGMGQGLYWPPVEAIVADLTTREQRNEAYALNRLGDNLGLSLGVAMASALVALTKNYRLLFVIDGLTYLIFLALLWFCIRETRVAQSAAEPLWAGWKTALRDRSLVVFALANIFFTTYIAQLSSSLPLYLRKGAGIPEVQIGPLFALHGALIALLQLPAARWLNRWTRVRALQGSALMWGLGFGLIWLSSLAAQLGAMPAMGMAALALAVLSLALVSYNPSASALVADLAPDHLRGVYLSINSLCWAVGFAIGPLIGGMALDLPPPWAGGLWLFWVSTVSLVWGILGFLDGTLPCRVNAATASPPQAAVPLRKAEP